MELLTFQSVHTSEAVEQVAALAEEIWTEHYAAILSVEQIRYMVDKYQSAPAIEEQLTDKHYHYYLVIAAGKAVGYVGIQPEDGRLFLSKL